jgi:DNA helicase-2/ATP-dependent DNA helicase PcrA
MLNQNQERCVKINEKSIFVVSGAGTGKTRVIYERIKYLISKKVDFDTILYISFTKQSTHDVKKRFIIETDKPVIKTFHGLAYSHNDSISRKSLVNLESDIFYEYDTNRLSQINAKKGVLTFKNKTTKPLSRYNALLAKNDLFDYVDLEIAFIHKMKDFGCVESSFLPYSYIFVDEAQDMSEIQFTTLRLLVKPGVNLFLVGDPDQSIYSFRGAQPSMVTRLINTFNCHVLSLNENYRSCGAIIDTANRVIQHNRNPKRHPLIAHRNTPGMVEYHMFSNSKNEAQFIFQKITTFLHQKYHQNDMVILVRNHFQATEIKRVLQLSYYNDVDCLSIHASKGLEYRIVFIVGIENPNVKDHHQLEEERRLFFVAITRAKDILIMTSSDDKVIPKFIKESEVKVTKH